MKIDKKVRELYPDSAIDYDEMADDIFDQIDPAEQEYSTEAYDDFEEPIQSSLDDIEQYDMNDEAEDDFDITYRTPDFVFEEGPKKAEMLIGTILPEEITVADNIEDYLDEKDSKNPGIYNIYPGDAEYENLEKKKAYNKKVKSYEKGSPAVYDPIYDEIIIRSDMLEKNNIPKTTRFLTHENVHKLEKNVAFRQPMPRVLSEPNTEMFKDMVENNVIENDWSNFLKGDKIGTSDKEKRQKFIKHRRDLSNSMRNEYAFSEQLAYFGEHTMQKSIKNPKRKTERVLNRMWFQ